MSTSNPGIPQGGSDYWLLVAATFLTALSFSCTTLLPVVVVRAGFTYGDVGLLLSSGAAPVVLGTLFTGRLIELWGPRRVVIVALWVMATGYLSLEWTLQDFLAACASYGLMLGGFGLFLPAAVVLVKSLVANQRAVYYLGVLSAMLQVPMLLGPAASEALLASRGTGLFFLLTGGPSVAAALLSVFLYRHQGPAAPTEARGEPLKYGALLFARSLQLPHISALVIGLLYGFMPAFVGLILVDAGVPVASFFVTFAVVHLLVRFIGFRYIGSLPAPLVVAVGLLLMGFSLVLLLVWTATAGVLIAATLFATGYSAGYPVIANWVAEQYPPEARGKPVALFTAVYLFGVYISPLVGGWLASFTSLYGYAFALAFFGTVTSLGFLATLLPPKAVRRST